MKDEKPPEDFGALLKEFESKGARSPRGNRRDVEVGQMVRGRVVSIGREQAFIDLGNHKAEGMINLPSLQDEGGVLTVAVGDEIEARVVEVSDAGVMLQRMYSRRPESKESNSARPESKSGRAESGSARPPSVKSRPALSVGAVVSGVVTTIKDYGAFVDIGGVEGMLHVSEISHARTNKVSDVLAPGQSLQVQILRIEKTENSRHPEKISLSLKSLARDPWSDVAEKFPPGILLKGTVTRVEAFGAFVELVPGIEGLIPLGEMGANRPIRHARDVVKAGQPVEVTVLTVDPARHRLSLGLGERNGAADPEDVLAAEKFSSPAAPPGRLGTFGDLFKNRKL